MLSSKSVGVNQIEWDVLIATCVFGISHSLAHSRFIPRPVANVKEILSLSILVLFNTNAYATLVIGTTSAAAVRRQKRWRIFSYYIYYKFYD